jgi:hypothetical protein
MQQEGGTIDPKVIACLMLVRSGLLQIVAAIDKYLGVEKKRRA